MITMCVCVRVCCISRSLLDAPLKMKSYAHRFHLLLHLEEVQMERDIQNYDLHNQTMTPDQFNMKLLTLRVRNPHSTLFKKQQQV